MNVLYTSTAHATGRSLLAAEDGAKDVADPT